MDSTAVALLAARQAHATGDESVHGLALVYEKLGVLSRERPYVESAAGFPGLQLHQLPGNECFDFDAYGFDVNPDEPVLSFYQSAMCNALLKRAAEIGAQTLMTGFGADELVGLQPFQLYDQLRGGHWLAAWREASGLAAARSNSPWTYLGRYGLLYFLPAVLRGGIGCWWRNGCVAWERQQAHTIGPWVRPEFVRRYRLWDRSVERLRSRSNRCRPLALSMALEVLDFGVGDAFRWEVGAPNGVHVAQPFLRSAIGPLLPGVPGPSVDRSEPTKADPGRRDARRAAGADSRTVR